MKNQVRDNWYEDFFSGINCELWEKAASAEWTQQEVDFLIETMNLQPGDRILDIPCGNGRHAIPLAEKGFHVTGVDISAEFLEKLKEKINANHLPIEVIQGNILSTDIKNHFSGAYCLGNSFGYFGYPGMKMFVEKVSAVLQSKSRFIINSGMIAESILPNYSKKETYTFGDLTMEINNVYVADDSYMVSHLHYTRQGKSEKHSFKHYVYTLAEIKRLLKLADLTTIAVYNSTEKQQYTLGDQQMYLVAERK